MTDDYTPTTRTVRGVYAMPQEELREEPQRSQVRQDREAMFDRWLAQHDIELLSVLVRRVNSSFDHAQADDVADTEYSYGYTDRDRQVREIINRQLADLVMENQ